MTRARSDRMRGSGFKPKEGRFIVNIREKFFIRKVMIHWKKLPREDVGVPTLEMFKARLFGLESL